MMPITKFIKKNLPSPAKYYESQGLKLTGGGEWRNAICPFHDDSKPSMRVRIETGAFCCMVCASKGGDVLAFHMMRYNLSFVAAAQALGAWGAA